MDESAFNSTSLRIFERAKYFYLRETDRNSPKVFAPVLPSEAIGKLVSLILALFGVLYRAK